MNRSEAAAHARASKKNRPRPHCGFCGNETAPQNKSEQRKGRFWCAKCGCYPATLRNKKDAS